LPCVSCRTGQLKLDWRGSVTRGPLPRLIFY
jgi:hypothetical protein